MAKEMLFGTVGGLGLFLFGMMFMSDGLKKVAGQKLKSILETMTRRRMAGFAVGAGVTAMIQSSSATTVMIISFVNAGLLTLKQAIPVIIGTNVGTTATGWLVGFSGLEAFKITDYALPAVAIGLGMQVFGKKQTTKNIGQILIGFGILFIGIGFMKDAFAPLENNQAMHRALVWFGQNPILAVLAGMVITMLLQSSSASVAMLQVLAIQGAFGANWNDVLLVVVPFILGDNIGTTITAQLASIQGNLHARRAAWAHTMFNVIGALIWFWFIGPICQLVTLLFPGEIGPTNIAFYIAITHTMIKVLDSIVFLPMTGVLEKIVMLIVKGKPGDIEARPVVLDKLLFETPVIALEQAKFEIIHMAKRAQRAVNRAVRGLLKDDRDRLDSAMQSEDLIDQLQFEITDYLAALSQKPLSREASTTVPVLLHSVNDLERIGDHAVNIVEIAERKISKKINFSDTAMGEANKMIEQANQMFESILKAMESNDVNSAQAALVNENHLNRMQMEFRRSHVQRMTEGACSPEAGLIFIDLVDNIEKIGDHLTNIAQAIIGGLQWEGIDGSALTGEYPIMDE
ncbi:Na/Pi cotransporter family protein [Planctomycetota bacterium]